MKISLSRQATRDAAQPLSKKWVWRSGETFFYHINLSFRVDTHMRVRQMPHIQIFELANLPLNELRRTHLDFLRESHNTARNELKIIARGDIIHNAHDPCRPESCVYDKT
jgi:threonyl-tRNA synthetase